MTGPLSLYGAEFHFTDSEHERDPAITGARALKRYCLEAEDVQVSPLLVMGNRVLSCSICSEAPTDLKVTHI